MAIDGLSRRRFMQQALLGMAASVLPLRLPADVVLPRQASINFEPDVVIALTAQTDKVQLFANGPATAVQRFVGQCLKGPPSTLQALPDSYLGPILRLQQGQKVRVVFDNQLPEPCIVHWHGLHVPQHSDGHPMYTLQPRQQYVYEFEVRNRAGSNFYHSHTHNLTAEQVYRGLAGLIVVHDAAEAALALPSGEYDLPLVIQDRQFDASNQLQYLRGMPPRMLGFLGNTLLVNGKPDAVFAVASTSYRLRVLNGSNARIYKLAWSDGTPLIAIASDGGLLAKPEQRPYIMLAPGERVELWADFSQQPNGSRRSLISLPFTGTLPFMAERMTGHGMGMMQSDLPQGSRFSIAQFVVNKQVEHRLPMPERLVEVPRLQPSHPTALSIGIGNRGMHFTLNGKRFAMDRVLDTETVALGSIQRIRISHDANPHGAMGGMMAMAHPIHLHGQQFQVVARDTTNVNQHDYQTVKQGWLDSGWKDTLLVMPGESVEIIKPFQDYKGLFLFHCHNLEHEDSGMMRQFWVQ